jgi:hypothetical protein
MWSGRRGGAVESAELGCGPRPSRRHGPAMRSRATPFLEGKRPHVPGEDERTGDKAAGGPSSRRQPGACAFATLRAPVVGRRLLVSDESRGSPREQAGACASSCECDRDLDANPRCSESRHPQSAVRPTPDPEGVRDASPCLAWLRCR